MKIYNTLNNKKEIFEPIDENHIKVYACGPTVYNYAHIGNARPAVVCDLLVRVLRQLYPKVTYVSNITDVDDKIMKASEETGEPIKTITEKYTKIYNEDMNALGVIRPDYQPRATDHISDMIKLVEKMISNGTAYESEGHVLFNVPSYKNYGALSGRDFDDQMAGSRIEVASFKKNPSDFVLWKPSVDNQPGWDSPWGFGRPGWHLECSAMSEDSLGLPFDIHGGGNDLIFPHHENEIAQTCGAHSLEKPDMFVKYWIHNGMLDMDGMKMSKSLGNILYIRDLLEKYPGEVLRLTLLSGHYRQPLNFNDKAIQQSKTILDRIYRVLKKYNHIEVKNDDLNNPPKKVLKALADDLNTSEAMAEINDLANKLNKSDDLEAMSNKVSLLAAGRLFGILQQSPDKWLGYESDQQVDTKEIESLLSERQQARQDRDFKRADEIRDQLKNQGIEIEDTPKGPIWKKIS